MGTRYGVRILIALSLAIAGSTLLAFPASAAEILNDCSGTCGEYQYGDDEPPPQYGANCIYETGSFDLDRMSARPPIVHGPFTSKSMVGWRMKVLRSNNFGSSWTVEYKSGWDTAMASQSIAAYAGSGFARQTYTVPENPVGWRKIQVNIRWWNLSGSSVVGRAKAEYNSYKRLWNGNSDAGTDHCIQDW